MRTRLLAAALACATTLGAVSGCTWVKATEDAGAVRVAEAADVSQCEKLGRTTSQVASRIAFVSRNAEKVQGELATLARNEAAQMGGDTVVATSPVEDGRQRFDIYRCRP